MFPLVVSTGALITRIASLTRSAAPVVATATTRLRAMGAQIGTGADALAIWVKANPMNAALAALTIGSLGVSVSDLFDTDEGKKVAKSIEIGNTSLADANKILQAGDASATLNLNIAENASDVYTAREILRWAKSHYGGAEGAIRAHRLQQAFFEMPLDDVTVGFDTIRL